MFKDLYHLVYQARVNGATKTFIAGTQAYRAKIPRNANPHPKTRVRHWEWDRGWLKGHLDVLLERNR